MTGPAARAGVKAPVPWRTLGRTDATAPALGFGVSGPHATALTSEQTTRALIEEAVALGAGFFDTAPFYGDGEAERRLGAALRGVPRDDVFVTTKVGTVRGGLMRLRKDFRPESVRASVERSLERLGLDHTDIVFLHGPAFRDLRPPLFDAMERLKEDGLTRFVGLCARGPVIDVAMRRNVIDMVMAPVRRDMAKAERLRLRKASNRGLGVIAVEALAPSQRMLRAPERPADLWYMARGLMQSQRARASLAPGATRPSPAACLRWTVRRGFVDAVIVTTVRAAHLRQCARVVRRALA